MVNHRETLRRQPVWRREATVPFSFPNKNLKDFAFFVTDFGKKDAVSHQSLVIEGIGPGGENPYDPFIPNDLRQPGKTFNCVGDYKLGPFCFPATVSFLVTRCNLDEAAVRSRQIHIRNKLYNDAELEVAWSFDYKKMQANLSILAQLYEFPWFLDRAAILFLPSQTKFIEQAFQAGCDLNKAFSKRAKCV